jgi:L-ascorbate metabolism protein UlaG (beta-lactamase superfamily)
MKITHFSNSFITIEATNIKICCDPWVGTANGGGWHSFPEYDKRQLIKHLENVDIVYISHLHDDHLDINFLIESKLVDKKFIIKNFNFKILINKLKLIGVREIQELQPYEKFILGKVMMSILPQMSSNSDDLDEDVEYDLDTSLIISDGTSVFFNQVDNPYSTKDYIQLSKWIESNYGTITIAALMAGAASEYPHMFLNINRTEEKELIVRSSLRKLV